MDHTTRAGERCLYGFLTGESDASAVGGCGGDVCVGLRSITIRGGGDTDDGGNLARGGSEKVDRVGDEIEADRVGLLYSSYSC